MVPALQTFYSVHGGRSFWSRKHSMAEQQNIVIFGASSGLGRAAARKAAAQGWRVLAIGRNADALSALAQELGAQWAVADIRDEAATLAALTAFDHIDHVVTSAGTVQMNPVLGSDMADLRNPFEERVFGAMHIVRAAATKMTNGSFTFITGDLADSPRGNFGSVSAAAASVEALVKAWVQELAPLRFNIISPGVIDTELQDKVLGAHKSAFMASVVAKIPVGKVGEADQIADAILNLSSNAFINGAILNVDGGMRHAG